MTSDPQTPQSPAQPRARRSLSCVLILGGAGVAWAISTAVHGYTMWPHIPMDISANDPATRAAFDAVVRRHVLWHLIIGAAPLLAALAFIPLVCKRRI